VGYLLATERLGMILKNIGAKDLVKTEVGVFCFWFECFLSNKYEKLNKN
jgi:hypothetical protein